MGEVLAIDELRVRASDTTGQKPWLKRAARASTVGELVQSLVGEMELPAKDSNGQAYVYRARLEREGRHLNASEIVGDALQNDDRIVLQPNVDAG